ncbi:MAG: hypothetical protein M1530_01085 [Candidatus Marsarchaeota archaeon]|nr:hypothetical protein [Candidatus Marsarchaeota archaeon]
MKLTNKKTYLAVRAILLKKKFKQYQISKEEKISLHLVNKLVNWMISLGYVARRKGNLSEKDTGKRRGYYELISPGAIFGLFPISRQIKPSETFNVEYSPDEVMKLLKGKSALCLTSALSYYDDYYRDPAIFAYIRDENLVDLLKDLPNGKTRVELFREDLNDGDFVEKKGAVITDKIRTIIDLYCANKAYAAERLIKKEFL